MGIPSNVRAAAFLVILAATLSAQTPRPTSPAVPSSPRPGAPQLPPRDSQTVVVGTGVIRGRVVRGDNGSRFGA